MDPTCPSGCADEAEVLPEFDQDLCAVATESGEISEIFLGIPGNPFTSVTTGTEWTTRLAATGPTKIVRVLVRGDRPRATAAEPIRLSFGRRKAVSTTRTIAFSIDDVNEANHEAIRQIQCGGNFLVWYRIYNSTKIFGGNNGIKAFIDADMLIPREQSGFMTYEGTVTWDAKFMEEMNAYPLA